MVVLEAVSHKEYERRYRYIVRALVLDVIRGRI